MSKCGENISNTPLCHVSFPRFDAIRDLLLNIRTATWNLSVNPLTPISDEKKEKYMLGDYRLIQCQIIQTNITRTVRRITNEFLGVKELSWWFVPLSWYESSRFWINNTDVLFLLYVGDDNPCKVINDAVTKYKNFTAKWNGITGSDHLPRYVLSLFQVHKIFYFIFKHVNLQWLLLVLKYILIVCQEPKTRAIKTANQ